MANIRTVKVTVRSRAVRALLARYARSLRRAPSGSRIKAFMDGTLNGALDALLVTGKISPSVFRRIHAWRRKQV